MPTLRSMTRNGNYKIDWRNMDCTNTTAEISTQHSRRYTYQRTKEEKNLSSHHKICKSNFINIVQV